MEVTKAALNRVAETGYDPVYGARPLKRTIQHLLENPLAQKLLAGEFVAGERIAVDVGEDGLAFSKAKAH